MSFQETRSAISICNKALGRCYQQSLSGTLYPIDPANQSKLAGRECARWYKATVRWLLEQHHWGLATKRETLTEIVNTRAGEWLVAYQKPSDMAFPVTLSPFGAGTLSYYAGVGAIVASLYGKPVFRYEGDTIWSLYSGGALDYVSYDITEEDFNETFETLVVDFLAARLALAVAKDREMAADYERDAMTKMNTAIAHSLNQTQPRYDNFLSEAELARGAGYQDRLITGYRY